MNESERYYARVKLAYNVKKLEYEQENENRIDMIAMYKRNIKLYEKELEE